MALWTVQEVYVYYNGSHGQEALRLGDGQRVGWSGVTGVDVSL